MECSERARREPEVVHDLGGAMDVLSEIDVAARAARRALLGLQEHGDEDRKLAYLAEMAFFAYKAKTWSEAGFHLPHHLLVLARRFS